MARWSLKCASAFLRVFYEFLDQFHRDFDPDDDAPLVDPPLLDRDDAAKAVARATDRYCRQSKVVHLKWKLAAHDRRPDELTALDDVVRHPGVDWRFRVPA